MNSIFNVNRFINYLQRDLLFSKSQYLYLFSILIGAYFLTLLIYTSLNVSLMILVKGILIASLILGPCVLEKTVTKYNGILEYTFPVSSFERFLTLLIKYVILLPVVGLGSYYLLTLAIGSLNIPSLDKFVDQMSIEWLDYQKIYVLLAFQSIFLLGYLSFERQPFLKTVLTCVVLLTVGAIVNSLLILPGMFNAISNPEAGLQGLISDLNIGNFETPLVEIMVHIQKYLFMFIFPWGLWIVSFFKVREKEI